MDDTAERIQSSPHFQKHRAALWRKWRSLAGDKEFLWETARLIHNLGLAYRYHPEQIRRFFSPVFKPTFINVAENRRRLRSVTQPSLRRLLERYISYVFRFGIVLRLVAKSPHFRTEAIDPDPSSTFRVKVVGGKLQPVSSLSWDEQTPIAEFFGSEDVTVAPKLQKALTKGEVKYVEIEDHQQLSLFRQLINFAYSSNHITFVLLKSDQPYVMCLIGDNVTVEKRWRAAGTIVTEFQNREYGRHHEGRPSKVGRLWGELSFLLRHDGPLKDKAFRFMQNRKITQSDKKFNSVVSSLSQKQSRLKL